jgi:hypothetical protein
LDGAEVGAISASIRSIKISYYQRQHAMINSVTQSLNQINQINQRSHTEIQR